jgi:hypothetical protein
MRPFYDNGKGQRAGMGVTGRGVNREGKGLRVFQKNQFTATYMQPKQKRAYGDTP